MASEKKATTLREDDEMGNDDDKTMIRARSAFWQEHILGKINTSIRICSKNWFLRLVYW